MSVTKSFCGLLGLMAVEQGKLIESELASQYVPDLSESRSFGGTTDGRVLDMAVFSTSPSRWNSEKTTQTQGPAFGSMTPPLAGLRRSTISSTRLIYLNEYDFNVFDAVVDYLTSE